MGKNRLKRMFLLFSCLCLPRALAANSPRTDIIVGNVQPWIDELPIPTRIKVAKNQTDLDLTMAQFKAKMHSQLPASTQWGYNGQSPGPVIEVNRGQKIRIHWHSQLPKTHLFMAPKGAMNSGGMTMPDVRSVVHLHGAVVTPSSLKSRKYNNDGWPDNWLTPGEEQIAEYPNDQSARILWYHDHAMGETGRNVAAGLAGMYLIRDEYEKSLKLPRGKYEIPLVLQTKNVLDDGSMTYTDDLQNEFYGNSIAVNGRLYPKLTVEPRKYRLRVVNASNARGLALDFLNWTHPQADGPTMYQIASDAGFLEQAVPIHTREELVLAPGERADLIVDFSKFAGTEIMLHNSHPPYEDADGKLSVPWVMLVKVGQKLSGKDDSTIPAKMKPIRRLDPITASATRNIVFDHMVMNGEDMMTLNGKHWSDPISERPVLGTMEVWSLINTLPDLHPFHVHLVQFQILDRTPFDVDEYVRSGKVVFTDSPQPPDANEMGWKDVVRSPPEMVTRIVVRFAPEAGYSVYHCHILEHEDMDMMRPFEIVARKH